MLPMGTNQFVSHQCWVCFLAAYCSCSSATQLVNYQEYSDVTVPGTAAHQPTEGQSFGGKIHMQTPTLKMPDSARQTCLGFMLLEHHYKYDTPSQLPSYMELFCSFPGTWSWWSECIRGMNLVCKDLEKGLLGMEGQLQNELSINILTVPTQPWPVASPPISLLSISLSLHLYVSPTLSTASYFSPKPEVVSGCVHCGCLTADKSISSYSLRKQMNSPSFEMEAEMWIQLWTGQKWSHNSSCSTQAARSLSANGVLYRSTILRGAQMTWLFPEHLD